MAIEIIRLERKEYDTSGLIYVLHKMLELQNDTDHNLELTAEAVKYYGENYELPELER